MIFVDDIRWAINVILHPSKNATQTWTVTNALIAYWKTAIIPMILAAILIYGLGGIAAQQLSSSFGGLGTIASGLVNGLLVGVVILEYLIFVPIAMLFGAAFIHISGKGLKIFKGGGYNATFSAMVYGILPWLVL